MPFCPNCGKEYTEGTPFCPNCGRPLQGAQMAPQPGTVAVQRPTGVTILAVLQIVGSLVMIGAGTVLGAFGGFIIFAGVLSLLFALALLWGRNWARILVLIGAVLDILSIVGIVWGVILLWYFTRKHVVAYFKAPK